MIAGQFWRQPALYPAPLKLCRSACAWKLPEAAGSCWKLLEAHRMQHEKQHEKQRGMQHGMHEMQDFSTQLGGCLSLMGQTSTAFPEQTEQTVRRFRTLYHSTRRHSDEALVSHGVLAAEIIFTTDGTRFGSIFMDHHGFHGSTWSTNNFHCGSGSCLIHLVLSW